MVSDDNRNRISWNHRWRNALAIDFQDYSARYAKVAPGLGTAATVLTLMERRITQGKVSQQWLSGGKGISGELGHALCWVTGMLAKISTLFRRYPTATNSPPTGFRIVERYEDKSTAPRHYKLRMGGGEDGQPHYVGLQSIKAAGDLVSPRGRLL